MKKLHIYLLLPLLSLLLNACLKDNTEAFSTSTALRLDEAAKQSKELLESSEQVGFLTTTQVEIILMLVAPFF